MSLQSLDIAAGADARPSERPVNRVPALALGELTRNAGSFAILIACIALGVAVIAGVGALSDALRAGFERQGALLLGGDATLGRPHQRATEAERAWMSGRGAVSETATLRAMARRLDGEEQALVEVKGVDLAYPLVGALTTSDGGGLATLRSGPVAIVEPILLERLGVKLGDKLQLGRIEIQIGGLLANEPDKIADAFTVGPRVFVSLETLEATQLAAPGGLVRWRYAMRLPSSMTDTQLTSFRDEVRKALPEAGFAVNDRRNPSPTITRTLDQLRQFLTLVGLASLMIGGVGVANAVRVYVERRRKVIAAMKSLGATSAQIFWLHLIQVLVLAAVGIAIGLAIGVLVPMVLDRALAGALPVSVEITVGWRTLLLAASYGLLVALLFSLWPLGRAGEVRATALFRDEVAPERRWPPLSIVATTAATALALVVLAIATSEARMLAVYFALGIAGIFVVFPLLDTLVSTIARRMPRPREPSLALALANLGAPGGLTRAVVLSLGAGLSLLCGVALVDASIVAELETRLPKNSPSYFLLDIPKPEIAALKSTIQRAQPDAQVADAPMLRGRLVALAGRPVEQIKAPPEAQWVLRGDRGLSHAATVPEGSRVVAGDWWAADHSGEPLVSFESELARQLGLKIGDMITVNVLGRNVSARIANLREVRWESLGINFVLVFSPNVLSGAPHNMLATVSLPASMSVGAEAALARAIGKAHPAVTVIRVRDAIEAFNAVFRRVMTAVRAAGGVTILAGAMVLAGALVTAQRQRLKLAVILKAIGGTRRRILAAHLAEYLILAFATAGVATLVGALGAWAVMTYLIKIPFLFSTVAVLQALGLAIGLVLTFGLVGTARVLRAPAVAQLRSE